LTEEEIGPLVRFARQHDLLLRFIEFMPLPCQGNWSPEKVLPAPEIRRLLEQEFGPLEPIDQQQGRPGPARLYRFAETGDLIGIVEAVSRPFCHECNRLRLTADGQVRNCLFDTEGTDLRAAIRGGADDRQLADLIRAAVLAKHKVRGGEDGRFARLNRRQARRRDHSAGPRESSKRPGGEWHCRGVEAGMATRVHSALC